MLFRSGYAQSAIKEQEGEQFEALRGKLVKYEEISDRIEYEIAAFLNGMSADEISESTSMKIKAMYKIVGELESLGDSGNTIGRILSRKNMHKKEFDAETLNYLDTMANAVANAYDVMIENLVAANKGELENIVNAYNAEEQINALRNDFREIVVSEIDNGTKNYQTSVYCMDIMNEYERMGDFMINISQDLERAFVSK